MQVQVVKLNGYLVILPIYTRLSMLEITLLCMTFFNRTRLTLLSIAQLSPVMTDRKTYFELILKLILLGLLTCLMRYIKRIQKEISSLPVRIRYMEIIQIESLLLKRKLDLYLKIKLLPDLMKHVRWINARTLSLEQVKLLQIYTCR